MQDDTLLDVRDLSTGYGPVAVVHDLNLRVGRGEIVALLGPNGAGKTTTILTLGGTIPPHAGEVRYKGAQLKGPLHKRTRRGIAVITEERSIFKQLTTATNLKLGRGPTEKALELFPELRPLLGRKAGLLSGGEQQILTLARALASDPDLLIVDELSLGLAPLVVKRLLEAVTVAAGRGVGVLLVEQHARKALGIADRAYVMRRGRVDIEGEASDLLARFDEIERSYLRARPSDGQEPGGAP
ncbi:MAG TPA: ATP-binding cassette domain-containing protein [Acidimicrobiales bacterium]|nr:ATP-binding cassette domain-containing protein [Acidimicrobiales bacterium]